MQNPKQTLDDYPLVLLTGTGCDERVFAPLIAQLKQSRPDREILVKVVGEKATAQHEAEYLLQCLPERFVLAGFSLGGIVALALYFTAKTRVAALILMNSNARADSPENSDKRISHLKRIKQKGLKHLITDDWPKQVAVQNSQDESIKTILVDMAKKTGIKRLVQQTEIALTRVDSVPFLKTIQIPVIVIAGQADQVCPAVLQHEIVKQITNAQLIFIEGAGHFMPIETPHQLAKVVERFLTGSSIEAFVDQKAKNEVDLDNLLANEALQITLQNNQDSVYKTHHVVQIDNFHTGADMKTEAHNPQVLQVERRDFTDLVPTGRDRVQSLEGFDDIYTDIVDYIIRCTHRIWDERDIGLIYTHYTHNCVLYTALGTLYDREDVVKDTIQRLVSFPERRGLATQVIWNGNDQEGFYTSHLVTGVGRHTQPGHFGPATGRTFVSRTIADCMIHKNKIYREWIATDTMALLKQLNLDPHAFAERIARNLFNKGLVAVDIGENGRMLGQYHPTSEAFTDIASNDIERHTLTWMHEAYNKRMFGIIRDVYAPNVQYHGPMMRELYGINAITHQMLGLIGSFPDAVFMPQHICSTPCEEGGVKVAVRWNLEGHHLGYGLLTELGEPTGKRVQLLGITHYHYKDGKIVDEWNVYDELALLMQIKLGQLAAGEPLHPVQGA